MNTEDLLRRELAAWAEEAPPAAGRNLSAAALGDLHHRRLRHRAAMLAAGLAVALVVVGVPVGLLAWSGDRGAQPASATAGGVALFGGPARGPLAGDTAFLAAATALPWVGAGAEAGRDPRASAIPDPPVSTRHVVWAGDVPGGLRMVVVAGVNNARPTQDDPEQQSDLGAISPVALAVFTGPAGAAADQLQLVTLPYGYTADQPFAVRDTTTGAVLIIGAPGDRIDVSARPTYQPDGTVTRDWQTVPADDGVAVLQVDNGSALQYQVIRDGVPINALGSPDPVTTGAPDADRPLPVTGLRPLVGANGQPDIWAQADAAALLDQIGQPADQVQLVVPWEGPMPAPHGTPATLTLTTATLPSGVLLLQAEVRTPLGDGAYGGTDCGQGWMTTVLPAGAAVADRTFALRCTVTDGSAASTGLTSLVVVAPTGAATVRLLDADGATLADGLPTERGVLVTSDADLVGRAASVEAFTADGHSLGATTLIKHR